jgi:importin-7
MPSACPVCPTFLPLRRLSCNEPLIPLLAVVYLKNRVSKGWSPAEDFSQAKPIPEDEKQSFRNRLVPILVPSQPAVRAQLIPTLQKILAYDFPQKWPNFLDITIQLLNAGDIASVSAGVSCLLAICKIYRFKSGENRADFDKIVAMSFPQLLNLGNQLTNESSLEAGEILRAVLKVYKHAIYV